MGACAFALAFALGFVARAFADGAAVPLAVANLVNLTSVVIAGLAIWYGLRRLPLALSAYAIISIGYPLLVPAGSQPLMSMPRFVIAAFPIFISMALFTERRPRAHLIVAGLMVGLCALLTAKFAIFSWVA